VRCISEKDWLLVMKIKTRKWRKKPKTSCREYGGTLFWCERRNEEKGRGILMGERICCGSRNLACVHERGKKGPVRNSLKCTPGDHLKGLWGVS